MNKKIAVALFATLTAGLLIALLGASSPTDPREAARLNNIGVAYMNQQLFEKALKNFDEAGMKDPTLRVVPINRAVAMLNLQRGEEAQALLEKAAQQGPKDPHIWYNLGLYYKNSSVPEKAVEAFKRVTEIDPDDADTWYFLGSTYAQLKQFPQAEEAFEHALKIDPLHASAQFGLSRAYQQSGDAEKAREGLKKFQYITQNKLGSPISLAYGEQGKYSRAEESPVVVQRVLPQIPVKFVDVTKEAELVAQADSVPAGDTYFNLVPGACFFDYDNDGKIDLFLPDNGTQGMTLYHNLGVGKFENVTKRAGFDSTHHAVSCAAGDYDNDGATDLAVSDSASVLLLHNEKDGTFKDVAQAAGIHHEHHSAVILGLTFIDYDHDGDLDLYVEEPIGQWNQSRATTTSIRKAEFQGRSEMWRNNGNGTFTDVTAEKGMSEPGLNAVGTDFNNDRAVDMVVTGVRTIGPTATEPARFSPVVFKNAREGEFQQFSPAGFQAATNGVAVLDFDHDGWMDLAFTLNGSPGVALYRDDHGKELQHANLPETNWLRAYGITAIDYDNDGWVDLVAVGETKEGKGEVRLFRNLGPDGWKDVTTDVGLDKIQLKEPRAIIAGDYDNDGAVDLLITRNHGPAVLFRNEGGNKNNSLRLALKGLNDNKSAIGTKVEVFSEGLRQKFEVYGSSGYLGQNSPYLTIGLGQAKQADVVRMLWPTGVLQDEIEVAANKQQEMLEIDRRGSSCPTLFAWDGTHYQLVGDMLGAGVVGHWVGTNNGAVERNIARPVEYIKIDASAIREKIEPDSHPLQTAQRVGQPLQPQNSVILNGVTGSRSEAVTESKDPYPHPILSFRFMEPLEESVYLDKVDLLAVDHPANVDVYPNEYFASNPPYPPFKVVFSKDARPPAGAWDEHGHDVLADLLAHRYFGDFKLLSFAGFTEPHTLELDLGKPYEGGPLWLLMHGEIEYFTATSMYAADQAHLQPFSPYLEAFVIENPSAGSSNSPQRLKPLSVSDRSGTAKAVPSQNPADSENSAQHQHVPHGQAGHWVRILDDLGFPAGGARTMTADLTNKLSRGTQRIRFTTNLQIYWDNILINRTPQQQPVHLTSVPLARADLSFHGFPLKVEGTPPGNVKYIYEQVSATGPYTRPAGAYTRYGDVRALLSKNDDKFAVFGSGDEVALDFDPSHLPSLPQGWVRDFFFAAHGYEKDMDFYAYRGDSVDPLPFREMGTYPYANKSFPADPEHLNYLLEYNTRFMSGNEASGYSFRYRDQK